MHCPVRRRKSVLHSVGSGFIAPGAMDPGTCKATSMMCFLSLEALSLKESSRICPGLWLWGPWRSFIFCALPGRYVNTWLMP